MASNITKIITKNLEAGNMLNIAANTSFINKDEIELKMNKVSK